MNIFWFRRDLRLHDNAGLYHALKEGKPVKYIFIWEDKRADLALNDLQRLLENLGSSLEIHYGSPAKVFEELASKYDIDAIFANSDYEGDISIPKLRLFKDYVIFEKDEVVKSDGKPYTVFTPYSKQWKAKLKPFHYKPYPGVKPFPSPAIDEELLKHYHEVRDYPSKRTSRMSVHLRFGTISVRELVRKAISLNETYLNELIWREFYQMILWHFPQVGKGHAFKKEYDLIKWRNNEAEFERWCNGTTGYPIVDAGMLELNETGFMHNRVRMITASFLTKHLLIDWRWGEAYFAEKLLDYDLASNNGGWQWAAGCGCDAAPYFRIFNPTLQTKKFDPDLTYTRKWVPEFQELSYPAPIVEHEFARKRCLEVYAAALKK